MKVNFYQLFITNPDGSIEPKVRIRVGGVEFGPGVRFGRGVQFSGIDFSLFLGKDFDVDLVNKVYVINGIYQ